MEREAFEKRVENLENAFCELEPESLVPDNIVQETDELLQVNPDNLTLLNLKALILMSDNSKNRNDEIVSVYEHILKLVPQNSQEAKEAKEMIDLYNYHADFNDSENKTGEPFIGKVSPFLIIGVKVVIVALFLLYIFICASQLN